MDDILKQDEARDACEEHSEGDCSPGADGDIGLHGRDLPLQGYDLEPGVGCYRRSGLLSLSGIRVHTSSAMYRFLDHKYVIIRGLTRTYVTL